MVRWAELKEEKQPSVAHRMTSARSEGPNIGEEDSARLPSRSFSPAVDLNLLSKINLSPPSGDIPAHLSGRHPMV